MNTVFEDRINEISMRLVMLDLADLEAGAEELATLLQELAAEAKQDPAMVKLVQSCEFVNSQRKVLTAADFIGLLNQFITKGQQFLRDPETDLPRGLAKDPVSEEVAQIVDPQFLVEFIEKHTTMMDDFESAIMDLKYHYEARDLEPSVLERTEREFEGFVKGYIHNVKGDAGSIGLTGLEKTCHFVEDVLTDVHAWSALDPLLAYREWVTSCMRALSEKREILESSAAFQKRFAEMCSKQEPRASAGTAGGDTDLPPEANLDLLAELLGEAPKQEAPAQTAAKGPQEGGVRKVGAPETYAISGDLEVFAEFCVEAEDHLNSIESLLLESDGNLEKEAIDSVFRGIHSIKGASSYFTLKDTAETSHLTENLLDEVRDGKRPFNRPLVELVLSYVDLQKQLLQQAKEAVKNSVEMARSPAAKVYLERVAVIDEESGDEPGVRRASGAGDVQMPASVVARTAPAAPKCGAGEGPAEAGKSGERLEVKNFVKVDTQRLDLLIDAIGETCIYSTMLIQNCRDLLGDNARVLQITHQVEKFSRDLQSIGMSMRLIPIRGLFQKMSRLVWDTSKKIGKEVKFQMRGEETELDRTIIDKLADPLMHMIRNALDHGIEPPDERVKKGKERAGTVTLSAYNAGGSIHIKIEDDGRGLDPDKLLGKAIEKGVVNEGQNLSREEIYNLIFAPGFSTAAVVTDISGRGVGMDVVKRNIESMRGRVHIESEVGIGSTFTIELPLTLAVIDGIQVAVGHENFIIPTLSIIEFMRPTPESITRTLDCGETFQFRGHYLPLYRIGDLFGIEMKAKQPEDGTLVVVEASGKQFAILVDHLLGTYSTVIKNLGEMFEQGRGVAGCAIMANGDVALILDMRSLLQLAHEHYTFMPRVSSREVGTEEITH